MTLMDLALETRDYEWAKQIYDLYNKPIEDKPEIKCELAKTKVKKPKNKNQRTKNNIIKELKKQGLYQAYLELTDFLKYYNDDVKRIFLRGCLNNPNEEDVESALVIVKVLEQ